MIFNYHSDGGHGWVKVEEDCLLEHGFAPRVTNYSYTDGINVYLEEDCDASRFFQILDSKGIQYKTKAIYDGDESPIRDLPRYKYNGNPIDKTA